MRWDGVVLYAGYLLLLIALTCLPARHCISIQQSQYGVSRSDYWLAALFVDLVDYLPWLVGLWALAAIVVAGVLWRSRQRFARALRVALPLSALAFFSFVFPMTISGAEFKTERGVHPTFLDWYTGMQQPGLISSGVGIFLLERFYAASIAAAMGLVVIHLLFWRESRRPATKLDRRSAAALLGVVAGIWLVSLGARHASATLLPTLSEQRQPQSQLAALIANGVDHRRAKFGAVEIFERVTLPAGDREAGAQLLGLPPAAGARLTPAWDDRPCAPHPVALPLHLEDERSPAVDDPLLRALHRLSRRIFEGRSRPPHLWQVLAESFRAADLHALNPRAPRAIAPYANGWYERGAEPHSPVLVSTRTHQASTRTSQGLAAATCGLGTLPFALSFVRDIGLVPFRCLPDVLVDAGYTASFYYGSDPRFDRMKPYLAYHGFERFVTESDFDDGATRQGWMVPDRMLFARSVAEASHLPADRPQYNVVMSLSNHFPYTHPADFPPEVERRVDVALRRSGRKVGRDDRARLGTFAYGDHALHELVTAIGASPKGRDSIIVITSDHSSPEYFVWTDPDELSQPEIQRLLTTLPLVIIFPDSLVESSLDPAALREALADVKRQLRSRTLSQNDIPRLLLALLAASPQLASLPPAWRWHSMGGQALSESFSVPGHADAAVMGIDAGSHTFVVSRAGDFVGHRLPVMPTLLPDQARQSPPVLRPAIAFFSGLLRGFARSCPARATIRKNPTVPQARTVAERQTP